MGFFTSRVESLTSLSNKQSDCAKTKVADDCNKKTTNNNLSRRNLIFSSTDDQANNKHMSEPNKINIQRRSTMNVTKMAIVDMSLEYNHKENEEIKNKESRRKTINPKSGEQYFNKIQLSPKKKRSQRRRTTYTPKLIELATPPTAHTNNHRDETPETSKTLVDEQRINDLCASLSVASIPGDPIASSTMQTKHGEFQNKLTEPIKFDSARKPGRRTVFDASMDIISERLQNINRSARRSTISNTIMHSISDVSSLENTTPTSTKNDISKAIAVAETPTDSLSKKKRKLFAPNTNDSMLILGTPPLPRQLNVKDEEVIASLPRVQKRRRTLHPITQPPLDSSSKRDKVLQRRSSMDFEKIPGKTPKNTEKVDNLKLKARPLKFMVCTNMHKHEKHVIAKVGAKAEKRPSAATTAN